MTREIIVDSFAGGGGASLGIEMALGRSPDIAINHDAEALAMHAANHPETLHLPHNVWKVDPIAVTAGRPVGLLWASPDCKHHSKAKGGKPVKRNIRDLAWVVVRWARQVRPRVILLENVEEFRDWGPVGLDGMPCRDRKGQTFDAWVAELRRLGYRVEWRELRACDYGAPTIRKRLFVIARRDGRKIVWPEPTHGKPTDPAVLAGVKAGWRTAAEIIDWSIPCPSIFLTREEGRAVGVNRPLADNTMARIAKGVKRYVLEAKEPFIVTYGQQGGASRSGTEPMHTVTASTKDTNAIAVPTLIQTGYGERPGQEPRVPGLENPLGTVVAGGVKHALVAAFLAQHNTDMVGHDTRKPISTIVGKGCTQALVSSHLMNMKGSQRGMAGVEDPLRTICAGTIHAAEVRAFLIKYYGADQDPRLKDPLHTATTKHHFGLVTVEIGGEEFIIADIGMRMLTPRELFRAQGFPEAYRIDQGVTVAGETIALNKTSQVRMCGNSVCPPVAAALVAANYVPAVEGVRPRKLRPAPLLEAAE